MMPSTASSTSYPISNKHRHSKHHHLQYKQTFILVRHHCNTYFHLHIQVLFMATNNKLTVNHNKLHCLHHRPTTEALRGHLCRHHHRTPLLPIYTLLCMDSISSCFHKHTSRQM